MRTWGEVRNFAKSKISRDTGVCYMQEWFEQKNTEISSHKQACGVGTGVVGSQRYLAEVAGVTFSDSESSPVPKFLNPGPAPGPAILQI